MNRIKLPKKIIMTEVDKLKNGTIDDWLIASVKNNMLRQYDLIMETPSAKTEVLTDLFAYNLPDAEFYGKNDRINAITKEDVQRVSKQYFSSNHITVPERVQYPKADFNGNPKFAAKLSYYPQVVWGYQGVPKGHKDEMVLDLCSQILSNSSSTGLS